jgi:nucleotide-binding universal stress UspA family protein
MSSYADALLALSSYPDVTPNFVVDQAVGLSALLGARISALMSMASVEKEPRLYSHYELLAVSFQEAIQKSNDAANKLLAYFEQYAHEHGVYDGQLLQVTGLSPGSELVAQHARLRDLTFIPVPELIGLDEMYIERVIFNSGRPTILLSAVDKPSRLPALETVVVAWDYSRSAARALGDSLPLLKLAKRVQVITVTSEKDLPKCLAKSDVERHLKTHGVGAQFENVDANFRQIGSVLHDYVLDSRADLLVMGAFGHSRIMEFILGGATHDILRRPPVPIFLSH